MTAAAPDSSGALGPSDWLDARSEPAPPSVRAEMDALLAQTGAGATLSDRFAAAALTALEAVIDRPSDRSSAITLLAADALLTYACEAAAEAGPEALDALTASLDFDRFSQLMATE